MKRLIHWFKQWFKRIACVLSKQRYHGIRAHGNKLYVLLDMVEERMVGSLYVPDKHAEHTRTGIIQSAGEEVKYYKVGDKVLVSYYSGVVIDLPELNMLGEGQDVHRVFTEHELLGHAGN